MTIQDIPSIVEELKEEGLTKCEPKAESDEKGVFYITAIKYTYVVYSDAEADALINSARQDEHFEGCSKKYKEGKMNKAGELVRPETYTVVIKMKY